MPAGSTERIITDRVERWVNQSPGIRKVESRSVTGVSVIKLYFRDDIDPTAALTMSNSLALSAMPALPPNTLPPVVLPFDPTGTLPLGIITVSNPDMSEAEVKDLARVEVRNSLGRIRGAVAPVVVGGKDRRVMIYLDPQKLESYSLSPVDVVNALNEGNFMATPGSAYFGDNQVALDTNVMYRDVEDFNDLPIRFGDSQIYLRDVGHAVDGNVIQKSRVRINGRAQVYIPVYRQGGASSLAVAQGTKAELANIEKELLEGSKLEFVIDQTESVRKAINSLIDEGVVGAVLVSVMILVFLGEWRMTVIAVIVLPLAVLCGITGLSASGNTINVMTLAGLFLAIGPLVDNAIVVLENTHRHLMMGKNPIRAAYDAAGEMTLPVLVATLATMIVLAPIAMTPGLGGFLFKPLALAVAFAMIGSYFLAFTVVPALCSRLLRGHHGPVENPGAAARLSSAFQTGLIRLTHRYETVLRAALNRRGMLLGGVAATFLASFLLVPMIGQEFFPQVDAGQITMTVRCPSNLRLDATEERVAKLEELIEQQIPQAERQMIVSEMGLNPDWSSAYTTNAGQQDAIVRIQLTEGRTLTAQQYAIKLRHAIEADDRFADMSVAFDTGGMVSAALNYGASSPIDIEIDGGTPIQRADAGKVIRERVAGVPGAADVRVVQRNDAPYLLFKVNRTEAAQRWTVGQGCCDAICHGDEFEHRPHAELLDRSQERQPIFRRGPIPGGPELPDRRLEERVCHRDSTVSAGQTQLAGQR